MTRNNAAPLVRLMVMKAVRYVVLAFVLVLVGGGCAESDPSVGDATSSSTPTTADRSERPPEDGLPEQVPTTQPVQGVTGEVPEAYLQAVVEDAASLAGLPVSQTVVITAQEMLWNDGSLGCPEPGVVYTQAQVSGYWVVVEAGSAAFDYRLTDQGQYRRCENPFGVPPGTGPPES